ncbi:MAG: multicopper oxidase family protein [Deltaproteobacteria bacterium]|nr:multicopper oxidase family protein [Deltaproteobacteria bacterium]
MDWKKINRRDFLKSLSVGVAGVPFILKSGVSLAQMGGGGASVIDPPPGNGFQDPVAMPLIRNGILVDVNLEAKIAPVNINGVTANLLTYNGYYPAPTISVKRGDILRVKFTNSLPVTTQTNTLGYQKNITNLHTHGWHVSPQEPGDAVLMEILPGQSYDYQYDTSLQEGGTLNYYHPHKHGLVAEQVWGGLAGALVVEDDALEAPLAGYETHTLVLKDISLSNGGPAAFSTMDYQNGKEGNIITVNGQVNPILSIQPGQVQRWRILNSGNARFYNLAFANNQGGAMYLAGTESGLLDKPYPRTQILLSPGERVEVLVQAGSTPGSFKFLSLPYSRGGMGGMAGTLAQITLLTLSVQGTAASDALPAVINPNAARLNLDTTSFPRRTLNLSMGQMKAYINGEAYQDGNPYTITSNPGTYEVWVVNNQTNLDHPFHQHTNAAQILALTGADASYPAYASLPAWKDTVLVPKRGSVTMLVPVKDFTGTSVFHCHIVEHEDIGMLGVWQIV